MTPKSAPKTTPNNPTPAVRSSKRSSLSQEQRLPRFDIFAQFDAIKLHLTGFHANDTIQAVKDMICTVRKIKQEKQELTYNDIVLENEKTLGDYGIDSNRLVVLRVLQTDPINVHIKSLTGKTFSVSIHLTDTIKVLKSKIEEQEGIQTSSQLLTFENDRLTNEDELLSKYKIVDGSVILLFIQNRTSFNPNSISNLIEPVVAIAAESTDPSIGSPALVQPISRPSLVHEIY
jgi:hypothetical protein